MKNIGKKLQLKPGQEVLLLNAPPVFTTALFAEGYKIANSVDRVVLKKYNSVQLFVLCKKELEIWGPQAVAALKPHGILWVAYPKKSSGMATDLTRDEGWKVMDEIGYEAVRQVALDVTWSSVRFRHRQERKKPSAFGVDAPGIDRVAKTVKVPADLQEALDKAGIDLVFDSLAFTHRKEYVLAVLGAKRPETRAKRIRKVVEVLASITGK